MRDPVPGKPRDGSHSLHGSAETAVLNSSIFEGLHSTDVRDIPYSGSGNNRGDNDTSATRKLKFIIVGTRFTAGEKPRDRSLGKISC